ncbi:MAG TPA: GNAT family N-acetyltransferase [bacterium]|nr:GNAT family N-acetyltransferase [bacterium]
MNISLVSPKSKTEVQDAYNFVKNILKFSEDHPRSLDFYLNIFQKDPRYVVIAKDGNEVIGAVLSSDDSEEKLLIGELAVDEKYRKAGVGTKLIQQLEENAIELGKNEISLGSQGPAENFYLKMGYTPRLFIQLTGNNRINEIKNNIPDKVVWENTGDGFSKIIVDTNGIDKELQKYISEKTGAHTQYLFSKRIVV